MDSGITLGLILLIYFSLGALMIYKINRIKDRKSASESWLKYLVYFGLILFQFVIIFYFSDYFKFICLWVILMGFVELSRLEIKNRWQGKLYFFSALIIFSSLSWFFYSFSLLEKPLLLITFFTVSAFDAFSQMLGQIFGKTKIAPVISPNKTVGGFIGGILLAILTALIIGNIVGFELSVSLMWGICISLSAFFGDIAASVVKRHYQVKDFSRLIPGHGGYLDRFDSFILAGATIYLINILF